jgi:type II secretory pathway component PulF
MFISRIGNRQLSVLCERVGVAFEVGQDPFRIFAREAGNGLTRYGRHMKSVAAMVEKGNSLAEAIKSQGNYFPHNFVRLVEVGEKTGRLEKVLERLADYYKDLADLRDEFMGAITWPLIQLFLGLIVVSVLIYVPSLMSPEKAEMSDLLGIGLVGAKGLAIFWAWASLAALSIGVLWVLMRNGRLGFLADLAKRVPVLGKTLLAFDEATVIQALALSIESGIDAWSAIGLSFRSAPSGLFKSKADQAQQAIRQGQDMHTVMKNSGLFCPETLDAVELGEDSGRLAETLEKHCRFLRMRVRFAMTALTHIASSLVWIMIASLLIMTIFRIFNRYLSVGQTVVERMYEPR